MRFPKSIGKTNSYLCINARYKDWIASWRVQWEEVSKSHLRFSSTSVLTASARQSETQAIINHTFEDLEFERKEFQRTLCPDKESLTSSNRLGQEEISDKDCSPGCLPYDSHLQFGCGNYGRDASDVRHTNLVKFQLFPQKRDLSRSGMEPKIHHLPIWKRGSTRSEVSCDFWSDIGISSRPGRDCTCQPAAPPSCNTAGRRCRSPWCNRTTRIRI